MYEFDEELDEAVQAFVKLKHSFTISEIKTIVEELVRKSGKYVDPITPTKLKTKLLKMLERGEINGYCLRSKPMVDDDGPYSVLEFTPHNPMALTNIELIEVPENFKKVTIKIHPYYKYMIQALAESTKMSQDMIARSILTKSLDLVFDQLK